MDQSFFFNSIILSTILLNGSNLCVMIITVILALNFYRLEIICFSLYESIPELA